MEVYPWQQPEWNQSTRKYSELATFLSEKAKAGDVIVVGEQGLSVLKMLGGFQMGCDNDFLRCDVGFIPIECRQNALDIYIVTDDENRLRIELTMAKKTTPPAKSRKKKPRKSKK